MITFELEKIQGDTDENHPAVDSCTICGKTCEPFYRDRVGDFHGNPTYDYFCETCGKDLIRSGAATEITP